MAIVASLVDQPSKLLLASKLPNLPKKQTNKPPNEEVTVGSWNALGTVYTESGYCKSLHVRSRLLGRDGFDLEAQHPFFFFVKRRLSIQIIRYSYALKHQYKYLYPYLILF